MCEKEFNKTLSKYADNFTNEDLFLINDYITTLQQELEYERKENTKLINIGASLEKKCLDLEEDNKQLKDSYEKEKYLVDKLTRQLTDEYKNTEYQCNGKNKYIDNWNRLENWLEEELKKPILFANYKNVLNKMQEIKEGDENDNK